MICPVAENGPRYNPSDAPPTLAVRPAPNRCQRPSPPSTIPLTGIQLTRPSTSPLTRASPTRPITLALKSGLM